MLILSRSVQVDKSNAQNLVIHF